MVRLFQTKIGRYLPYCIITLFILIACISTIEVLYFMRLPIQSNNWAGYQASSNRRGVYSEANMVFTVPRLKATQGQNASVAEWAGLGGGNTFPQKLVRVGVRSDINSDGIQTDHAFWEVTGNGLSRTQIFDLNVMPDDVIRVYVGSNADHDGNRDYDGFLVEDITQGTEPVLHYEHDPATFSDSSSAECIIENPEGGQTHYLANFGTITILSCGVYTNGQQDYTMVPIDNFNPDRKDMVDKNGLLLARTSSSMDGTSFQVTWKSTGNGA